jgi:hypothetical protein
LNGASEQLQSGPLSGPEQELLPGPGRRNPTATNEQAAAKDNLRQGLVRRSCGTSGGFDRPIHTHYVGGTIGGSLETHSATHAQGHALHDRKSQAEPGTLTTRISASERLEQVVLLLRGYARPVVLDLDDHFAVLQGHA